MQKRKAFIVSVVLAVIAAILAQAYLISLEKKYRTGAKPIEVLIAKGYIPERTLLTEHMVTTKKIPAEHVAPKALTQVQQLWNQEGVYLYSTVVPIESGEQIVTTKLIAPGRESGVAMVVPEGKRAITVPVDAVTGVADLIRPGHKVDVLVTLEAEQGETSRTATILQNVQVLAVKDLIIGAGTAPSQGNAAPQAADMGALPEEVAPTVTLALTPQEAQVLAHAMASGTVRLTVRGLNDSAVVSVSPTTRSALR